MKNWMPEKFRKYPWVTVVIFVSLVLVIAYAAVDLFGAEWVRVKIDRALGDQ